MEEKSVVASMSKEMILSIEDLQREGSKKLPTFKRGKSFPSFCSPLWWTKSGTELSTSQLKLDHIGYFHSGCLRLVVHSKSNPFQKYSEFWNIEILARR